MEKAAKDLDFMEVARLRDKMSLQKTLEGLDTLKTIHSKRIKTLPLFIVFAVSLLLTG